MITVQGPCDNRGGDADGDGVCRDEDCDDNNPNVGARQTPGTVCNDGDPNTVNDVIQSDGCTCRGTNQVDLELTKTVNRSTVQSGEEVIWTVTVLNRGPSTATNVTVRDVLPTGVTFLSSAPSQGTFNAASSIWTIGSLGANQIVTLQLQTRVTQMGAGTIRNFAQVQTASPDDIDSTPGNDVNQTPDEDDEDDASITVMGPCDNRGGDADGDGVCRDEDCDDNNPNVGARQTPGTACNDGDPNTINDVIQSDGCT